MNNKKFGDKKSPSSYSFLEVHADDAVEGEIGFV